MKKLLLTLSLVLVSVCLVFTPCFAALTSTSDISTASSTTTTTDSSSPAVVNNTAPVIDNIRGYIFPKSPTPRTEFVTITAKDFDNGNIILSVNTSSMGTYAGAAAPVTYPGYASVVVGINTQALAVGDYVLSIAALDGDPTHTQTAEIPIRITLSGPAYSVKLNDTLTKYVRIPEGSHFEQGIVLEGMPSGLTGSISIAGLLPPYITYVNDGSSYAPQGKLVITGPMGSAGSEQQLVVRGITTEPKLFTETKLIVEFVKP